METRTCKACKIERNIFEFGEYRNKEIVRRRKTCNPCRRAYQVKRYKDNPHIQEKNEKHCKALPFEKIIWFIGIRCFRND